MANQRQKPVDSLVFRRGGRGGQAITLTRAAGHAVVVPDPPKGLTYAARAAWHAFWRSEVAALVSVEADMAALCRWIACLSERERIEKRLVAEPLVPGSMGQDVLNPLASYSEKLGREIRHYEDRFGMTPLGRMRLGVTFGQYRQAMRREADPAASGEPEIEEMPSDIIEGECAEVRA